MAATAIILSTEDRTKIVLIRFQLAKYREEMTDALSEIREKYHLREDQKLHVTDDANFVVIN